jgi:hypothetical protein
MREESIRGNPGGSDRSLQNRLDDRRDDAPIHRMAARAFDLKPWTMTSILSHRGYLSSAFNTPCGAPGAFAWLQGSFYPTGLTDQLQPLDRMLFGCLKAAASSLYIKFMHDDPGTKQRRHRAVQILQIPWDTSSEGALQAAWATHHTNNRPKQLSSARPGEGKVTMTRAAAIAL